MSPRWLDIVCLAALVALWAGPAHALPSIWRWELRPTPPRTTAACMPRSIYHAAAIESFDGSGRKRWRLALPRDFRRRPFDCYAAVTLSRRHPPHRSGLYRAARYGVIVGKRRFAVLDQTTVTLIDGQTGRVLLQSALPSLRARAFFDSARVEVRRKGRLRCQLEGRGARFEGFCDETLLILRHGVLHLFGGPSPPRHLGSAPLVRQRTRPKPSQVRYRARVQGYEVIVEGVVYLR